VEHHDLVLVFVRFQVDQLDYFHKKAEKYAPDAETTDKNHAGGSRQRVIMLTTGANCAIILGAKQKSLDIRKLLEDQSADPAFVGFRVRVSRAVLALGPELVGETTVNDSHQVYSVISFMSYPMIYVDCAQITEYRFLKVKYESTVDWHVKTDYLRCNPCFNGRPRYDFVIIKSQQQACTFARLIFVFVCHTKKCDYHLALVQPLEKKLRSNTRSIDRSLSIYGWHPQARDRCSVIPVERIIRRAVLMPDAKFKGDHFVIDTLDADMFLRMKNM